jgi:DDE superfamily endonuclease
VSNDSDDTAAKASIGEVSGCADRVDAQVRVVLGRVLAQRRSAGTALAYVAGLSPGVVAGLSPGVKANCWALAEAAGPRASPAGWTARPSPRLAEDQLERLLKAGLPARWAAFDEVYGRSSALRGACEAAGLPYVAVIPRDFRITLPAGAVIKAADAVKDAVFERRSCGNGSKGPRYADWALAATASPRHVLPIRRLLSRPGNLTFYLCRAPEDQPTTMRFFITIAGRRWPIEQTFRTGKDVLGWDQCQARTWDAICRHTALAALAQLRDTAIRNALCGDITLTLAAKARSASVSRPRSHWATARNPCAAALSSRSPGLLSARVCVANAAVAPASPRSWAR